MRIAPVYVIAPLAGKTLPTRRAFLLASGTFLAGTVVGGACGYSLGAARAGAAPQQEPELPSSNDVELDELRRLAVKAPIDELFEKALPFLHIRVSTYKNDEILWRGVDRLSKEIIENPGRRVDLGLVLVLIGQIEGTARPENPSLRDRVPALRLRRDELRRPR
ncbi:MAG: hypothetical protein FJ265_06165 [Planctomycetes bacterium]|nr:hypothetical protein [Planctomycetota bacterium]